MRKGEILWNFNNFEIYKIFACKGNELWLGGKSRFTHTTPVSKFLAVVAITYFEKQAGKSARYVVCTCSFYPAKTIFPKRIFFRVYLLCFLLNVSFPDKRKKSKFFENGCTYKDMRYLSHAIENRANQKAH